MDVIIVAGVSKDQGKQYSVYRKYQLTRQGRVMTYNNLRELFGFSAPDERGSQMPYLAGIYLYNYLTRRGLQCALINFLDRQMDDFEKLLSKNPSIVAISTTYLNSIREVKRVTETIRKHAPDVKIVVGGTLIFNSYNIYRLKDTDYDTDSCVQDYFFVNQEKRFREDIDVFVIDEQGESTLAQLARRIKDGKDYRDLSNLAYYRDDRLIITNRVPEDNSFSEDLIDWDQTPREYLHPVFPMRGSRGCPYECGFCNFGPGRTFRLKPPEIFSEEIAALVNTGIVKVIRFTDDNLFLNRKQVEIYCRQILKRAPGIKWTSFIRASSITRDNVTLLRESGCVLAQIGIESGDSRILKEMNKRGTPEMYLEAVDLLNSHGISTQLYIIIGYPGETRETIDNTVALLNQFAHKGPAINQLLVFPFGLIPLSPVYEPAAARKYGLSGYMQHWTHQTMTSEEAMEHALNIYDRVQNFHPNYGIDEFHQVEGAKLKKLYQLRA
ncbi:MAG: radical SAM protein, partial [Deltaproteobacteria bacterium]|nr:radical SAM protein [Deltaproteobacteria bacterium]